MSQDLRNNLINQLKVDGAIKSSTVEAAMRSIPRETFATWVLHEEAYENKAIVNPYSSSEDISTISQPFAVARFLEGFDLGEGMNVLEVGAGTGYQAALISHMVGAIGQVTTVETVASLIDEARKNLKTIGIKNVQVIHGDGAIGYAKNALYDRIVATVGLREIPIAWINQLKPDGRIIIPLHVGGDAEHHALTSFKRAGNNLLGLVGYGLDSLDMVVLRGPHADESALSEEEVKRGADWDGGYANELKIQVFPKDANLQPERQQKLIHTRSTSMLVEVR